MWFVFTAEDEAAQTEIKDYILAYLKTKLTEGKIRTGGYYQDTTMKEVQRMDSVTRREEIEIEE